MKEATFLQYLEYEKRFSPHTILAYRKDLEQFIQFLNHTFKIEIASEVKHQHVRSWVVELVSLGRNPQTIRRKISTLKTYFRFLLKHGHIDRNPMLQVSTPKEAKRLPVFIHSEDLAGLFDQLVFPPDFPAQRDRIILELLYATGMRRSELLALKVDDIDSSRKQIRILGKGGKERLVPFGSKLKESLDAYLLLRAQTFPELSIPEIILTDKGHKAYPKLIYNTVKKYLSIVSTVEKKSPHVLRHSFATHLSENGAELNAIKELLGHSTLAATQVYTHNSIEKLRKIYEKAHPKAKSQEG